MKKFTPYLAFSILLLVTVFSGYVSGKLSNRWGLPPDMLAAQQRVEELEQRLRTGVGDWQLVRTEKMLPTVEKILETETYINGSWVNHVTGETVNGFIVLGHPGPISVHTPEVCYSSREYEIKGKRKRVKIGKEEDSRDMFWSISMRSNDVNADELRVYYAWANSRHWDSPESPRKTFGGAPLLYKFQLAAHVPPGTTLENDTGKNFLEALLPVVNAAILK